MGILLKAATALPQVLSALALYIFWNRPVFFFCLVGTFADPSLKWAIPCILAFIFVDPLMTFLAEELYRVRRLKENINALPKDIQLIEITHEKEIDRLIEREKAHKASRIFPFCALRKQKIRVFAVSSEHSIAGGALSIMDSFGTSIVILEGHPSSYNLLQRFTLYRELEYVGIYAKEVSQVAVDRVREWTIICLSVLNISGGSEYLKLLFFLVYFEINLLLGRSYREVSADRAAAYELSKDVENDEFIRVVAELATGLEYEADVAEERKETYFENTQRYRAKHLRRIACNPSLFLEKHGSHEWVTPSTVWAVFYLPLSILAAAIFLDHRNAIADHWLLVTSMVALGAISLQLINRLYFYKQGEKLHAALNLYIHRATYPDAKDKALYLYSDKRNSDVLVGDRKFFEQCLAEGRIDSSTLTEILRDSNLE